ncbi:hypothetical protein BE17_34605 [Sorangium cellulosum]|uniref:Uncharacterized protein n=1 Tax=Sorangium cellulosum TaxID=56 RepID=A0A150S6P4_SORCE|nr:hypothetical protein BE17_34605 [Sorangium cellulosum]
MPTHRSTGPARAPHASLAPSRGPRPLGGAARSREACVFEQAAARNELLGSSRLDARSPPAARRHAGCLST